MGEGKGELRGRSEVLLDEARKAGHSDTGHAHICSAIDGLVNYMTNGHADEVAEVVCSTLTPKLLEMEKRLLEAQNGNGKPEVAFRVRNKSVSNAAYKRLVVGGLAALITALPTLQIGGCVVRSKESEDRLMAERKSRMEQFATVQSNQVAILREVAVALKKIEEGKP